LGSIVKLAAKRVKLEEHVRDITVCWH
jgi:hypothetical protein